MAEKKASCWFFHKWREWSEPYTPPGYYPAFAIQRRACERCNKTQQRIV